MSSFRACALLCVGLILIVCSSVTRAGSFPPQGNLDCNGFSTVQKPLKIYLPCTDFVTGEYAQRGYDNGHYIGHDEPSIGFYSTLPHSGNAVQWDITLPVERPLPAVQSFETFVTFWFSMALCDTNSFPNGACIPDSDENTPSQAGSALLELQLYPPGFVTGISCDTVHWCSALNIDSLEVTSGGGTNPACTEPVNFAYLQRNGIPTGPPGPATATNATFNPNANTLLMNPGDHLRITIKDTPAGLLTRIDDLTTGQSGFMVASAANGFQNTDPNTCAGANYGFHPEYDTAKFGNFMIWGALQANVNFSMELGHFTPGANGDGDADDPPCFPAQPGVDLIAGCLNEAEGGDIDFDGTSYVRDWPDGTRNHATSVAIRSVTGSSVGPMTWADGDGNFNKPYPIMQFETEIAASVPTCQTNGVGCSVPPPGAKFYPFYALEQSSNGYGGCALVFGNFSGPGINNFGGDAQYGAPNLSWFFAQDSSGPRSNVCLSSSNQD
jgi:hypothetical protein